MHQPAKVIVKREAQPARANMPTAEKKHIANFTHITILFTEYPHRLFLHLYGGHYESPVNASLIPLKLFCIK
jgi:hypothetical protein